MWILVVLIGLIFAKVIISSVLNHPKIRGRVGESRVQKQLEKLPREHYTVLNNVMLKARVGTSQIDHIVVSPNGIFVIETKNYTGWIYGNEDSDYWTQFMYRRKTKFRNPIKQKWGHIFALRKTLLKYEHLSYYPVIVFAGKAKLRNINTKSEVIHPDQLIETITNHKGPRQLTNQDMENIVNILRQSSITDKELKNQHIERIRWNVKIRKLKEKALMCPKCGGRLIKRDGRYGQFYSCERFPECKYKTVLSRSVTREITPTRPTVGKADSP